MINMMHITEVNPRAESQLKYLCTNYSSSVQHERHIQKMTSAVSTNSESNDDEHYKYLDLFSIRRG
jgi:hypothetical protein